MKFNYKKYIEEKRNDDYFKETIDTYEKYVGKIKDKIEEERWFKSYCLKFIDLYRDFKVPEETRDLFDWKFLFVLTCSSFSQNVKFIVPNKIILNDANDLDLQITVTSEGKTIVKLISELYSFQISKLYDIYIKEQMELETLVASDQNEAFGIYRERLNRFKYFADNGIEKKNINTFLTERSGLIYHYTSFDTIYKIISNKCIWASDIRCLNDRNELKIGVEIFNQVISYLENTEDYVLYEADVKVLLSQIVQKSSNSIFNASFSYDGDLLSQWRAYGDNGQGICIGINKEKFISMLEEEADTDSYYGLDLNYSISDCFNELLDQITEFIRNCYAKQISTFNYRETKDYYDEREKLIDLIWTTILTIKDNAFFEEKEWRVLYIQDKLKQMKPIEYFSKGNMMVPYIRIDLKNIPIELIRLGPCVINQEVNKIAIQDFLLSNGINASVETSKIPYRI